MTRSYLCARNLDWRHLLRNSYNLPLVIPLIPLISIALLENARSSPKPTPQASETEIAGWINITAVTGSDRSGQKDNSAALSSAISKLPPEGGTIFFPAGIYRFSSTQVIVKSNVTLSGTGINSTKILGDLEISAVIQEGDAKTTVYNNAIEDLTVGRAAGLPPRNSIGIYWASFNYGRENRVLSTDHYYDRKWDDVQYPADISIGYDGQQIYAMNAVRSYASLSQVADIRIASSEFGRNKGELYNPPCGIEILGTANNINFEQTWFIPRGPTNYIGSMVCFRDIPISSSGLFKFSNSYGENWNYIFSSADSVSEIKELAVIGGHYTAFTNIFEREAARTTYVQMSFEDSNITGNTTIQNVKYSRFNGNNVGGRFALVTDHVSDGDVVISGNTFSHEVNLSGVWANLVFVGNVLHMPSDSIDASAGHKAISGNSALLKTMVNVSQ